MEWRSQEEIPKVASAEGRSASLHLTDIFASFLLACIRVRGKEAALTAGLEGVLVLVVYRETNCQRGLSALAMADKRKSSPLQNGSGSSSSSSMLVKRQRQGDNDAGVGDRQIAIASSDGGKSKGLIRTVKRTSSLSSPILSLSGAHNAEILDVKFSPDGQVIAAASSDKTICAFSSQAYLF